METNLSLEDYVKVRLTNQGEIILSKIKNREIYNYYFDEFDYLNIKVWALMQIFGPIIKDNKNNLLFDSEIIINNKEEDTSIKIFNIYDYLNVRLTSQGNIRLSFSNKFMYNYSHETNGKLKISFYDLMQIFGSNLHNTNMFDGNIGINVYTKDKCKKIDVFTINK